jgi:hypothetical protein
MTERLLQYIWQFQYYNKQALALDNGDPVQVIHPGRYNTNQGPDFLEAKIKIENTLWVGHVELHLKTSDWFKHAHHLDRNYDNVVLHVVWENDQPDGDSLIPVFSLQSRVARLLLHQYEAWMNSRDVIPCGGQARQAARLVWISWLERLSAERLQRKANEVCAYLQQNNQHWEETFWWMLARSFGNKLNTEPFEAMAKSLPFTLLAKYKNQLLSLEALLLGQCGLLQQEFDAWEEHPVQLQREYAHLQKKHRLTPVPQAVLYSKTLPANFPDLRLAQLAALIHQSTHLFAHIKDAANVQDIKQLLAVTASAFWDGHYRLKEPSVHQPKKLGHQTINSIIINAVVPVLFAYGHSYDEEQYKNKALNWLAGMPPEKNKITREFKQQGIDYNYNGAYSQALIELRKCYCNDKRCLDCSVGNALLKKQAAGAGLAAVE